MFSLLLLYSQTTALLYVVLQFIILSTYILIYKKNLVKKYSIAAIIAFMLFIPQLILLCIQLKNAKLTFWNTPWEWSAYTSLDTCMLDAFIFNLLPFLTSIPSVSIIYMFIISIGFIVYKTITSKDKILAFFIINAIGLMGMFYFLHTVNIITLYCNANYFLLITSLFLICILFALSKINFKVLFLVLMLNLLYSVQAILNYDYFTQANKANFGAISKYIKFHNYNNCLIFIPFGDSLIKKYDKNYKTFGVYTDALFTMPFWQKQANIIFDKDLSNMNLLEKTEFIEDYLLHNRKQVVFKKSYDNQIENLRKNEYFIILLPNRDYVFKKFEFITKNMIKANSKSLLVELQLYNTILRYAGKDSRLKLIKLEGILNYWVIFVFKKV